MIFYDRQGPVLDNDNEKKNSKILCNLFPLVYSVLITIHARILAVLQPESDAFLLKERRYDIIIIIIIISLSYDFNLSGSLETP